VGPQQKADGTADREPMIIKPDEERRAIESNLVTLPLAILGQKFVSMRQGQ
jgi:hypothetical protein